MGYTHYWEIKSPIGKGPRWEELCDHVNAICAVAENKHGVNLAYWVQAGGEKPCIDVNGIGEDAHENLVITPSSCGVNFCKTRRKPYDRVIVAILEACAKLGLFSWSSDGDASDHEAGKQLFEEVQRDLLAQDD